MAIKGYVREWEPTDADWSGRTSPVPSGHRLVIVDELSRNLGLSWRVELVSRPCRMGRVHGRKSCGAPSVVALERPHGLHRTQWWPYCAEHTFGRKWDGRRLLAAIAVEEDEQP